MKTETLTLTAKQLREALEYVNPDGIDTQAGKEQQETELNFFFMDKETEAADGDGKFPTGMYCYLTEYPEEGIYGPLGTATKTQETL